MDDDAPMPTRPPATVERRVSPRVQVRAAVRVENGARPLHGRLRNLSTGGMYVETGVRIPPGTSVVLETLAWEDGTAHLIRIGGWVAHADDDGCGIRFDPPDDRTGKLLTHLVGRFLVGP